MIYLKFQVPDSDKNEIKSNKIKKFITNTAIKFLKKIIPEANPDYDGQLGEVKFWIVEIDRETNLPNREIGLDEEGKVIMIMPDDRNYGYWTNNNLTKEDFESNFETVEITNDEFNQLWGKFESK